MEVYEDAKVETRPVHSSICSEEQSSTHLCDLDLSYPQAHSQPGISLLVTYCIPKPLNNYITHDNWMTNL